VDILRVGGPGECVRRELARDPFELPHEERGLVRVHDPLPAQHARVSDAPAHVVRRDASIEIER
jgi:hypothetical protein